MQKLNVYETKMLYKYGSDWNAPLFNKQAKPASQSKPEAVQTLLPVVDDATEAKAVVYDTLSPDQQRLKVLEVLRQLRHATDNQIARRLRIHPSTVAARRNELRDRGLVLPVLDPNGRLVKIKDDITNQSNTVWRVV